MVSKNEESGPEIQTVAESIVSFYSLLMTEK